MTILKTESEEGADKLQNAIDPFTAVYRALTATSIKLWGYQLSEAAIPVLAGVRIFSAESPIDIELDQGLPFTFALFFLKLLTNSFPCSPSHHCVRVRHLYLSPFSVN